MHVTTSLLERAQAARRPHLFSRCAVTVLVTVFAIVGAPGAASPQTTVHRFNGSEGGAPRTALIQGSDGYFYGTTRAGGFWGRGTVFKMDAAGNVTVLHSFTEADGSDPSALLQASDGKFYGTTRATAFRIDAAGNFTTFHAFTLFAEGLLPSGLIQASDGAFYGTTFAGGEFFRGTVFRLAPDGTLTTLHNFTFAEGRTTHGVIQASDGNFYGTTSPAGVSGAYSVFRMDAAGTVTVLRSFDGAEGFELSGLIEASDGRFYGTAAGGGGARGAGTVFRIDAAGTLEVLHSFSGEDGATPWAGLIEGSDGRFYGTTLNGGFTPSSRSNLGTVFTIDEAGTLTTLHRFTGIDGARPFAGVTEALDRRLYGTTEGGGYSTGVVFRLTPGTGQVAVSLEGEASGTVISNPEGIDCPGDCTSTLPVGDAVTLTAAPGDGVTFHGWGGACSGSGTCTVTTTEAAQYVTATFLPTGVDLLVTELSEPPAALAPGWRFTVTHMILNQDGLEAGSSTTRFYFANGLGSGAAYRLLSGSAAVPVLAGGASSSGQTLVQVASTMPLGTYWLVACADDRHVIDETDEGNNCRASGTTVRVALPDLVVTSVVSAAQGSPGQRLVVTDVVLNQGAGPARNSRADYYLSTDQAKSAGDVLLSGGRAAGALAPSATSSGSQGHTVPRTTPHGLYYLLACADAGSSVSESNEGNNCTASATTLLIGSPDLITTSVSDPPATVGLGGKFAITDTVLNQGELAADPSATRYYLSLNATKDSDDVRLGYRSVGGLAPGVTSTGIRTVTVPSTALPNVYYVLACADQTAKVPESNELNNCRASATSVVIHP